MQFYNYPLAMMDFQALSEIGVRLFLLTLKQESVPAIHVDHRVQEFILRIKAEGLVKILNCTL
jgi:hypothetical protein